MSGRGRGLLWRVGVALVATQAIVSIVVGTYAFAQIRRSAMDQAHERLRHQLPLIAERCAALRDARLDAEVKALSEASGVRITLIDADGTVVADSHHEPAEMDNHRFRPEIDAAISTGSGTSVRYSATLGLETLYRAEYSGAPPRVVRVATSLTNIDRRLKGIAGLFVLGSVAILLVTIGVLLLFSRPTGRTITAMAAATDRFARGDFGPSIDRPAAGDLARLCDALNDMARDLGAQISTLQTQRAEQRTILQSMSNGMIALDLDQRVLSINRAAEEILDLEFASSRGRLLQEIAREPALNRFVATAIETGAPTNDELRLEARGGLTIEALSEPLRDEQQERIGLLLLIDDVTQLRRLERLRSDFAANVSHELRTPITKIKGYVETMLDVGCGDEKQTLEFLDVIRRSADRLEAIIEDLLSLAELEQTGALARPGTTVMSAGALIDAAIANALPAAAEKRITIERAAEANLDLRGSPQLIEQALGNLLANAINYSGEGTTVTVRAQSADEDGMIAIAVADEGPGIAPQHLPRLFERFYRVDPARSRLLGGTGLGLAITKHIALVHGGRAEVESEVGRGSVFRLVLPRG